MQLEEEFMEDRPWTPPGAGGLVVHQSRIHAGWTPAHQCRWDVGLHTPWVWAGSWTCRQVISRWKMSLALVPLPCRSPLHPKI